MSRDYGSAPLFKHLILKAGHQRDDAFNEGIPEKEIRFIEIVPLVLVRPGIFAHSDHAGVDEPFGRTVLRRGDVEDEMRAGVHELQPLVIKPNVGIHIVAAAIESTLPNPRPRIIPVGIALPDDNPIGLSRSRKSRIARIENDVAQTARRRDDARTVGQPLAEKRCEVVVRKLRWRIPVEVLSSERRRRQQRCRRKRCNEDFCV